VSARRQSPPIERVQTPYLNVKYHLSDIKYDLLFMDSRRRWHELRRNLAFGRRW